MEAERENKAIRTFFFIKHNYQLKYMSNEKASVVNKGTMIFYLFFFFFLILQSHVRSEIKNNSETACLPWAQMFITFITWTLKSIIRIQRASTYRTKIKLGEQTLKLPSN